jgi:acyl-CoA hydrolase
MAEFVSAEEAVKHILSGMRVFVHGSAATPRVLLESLVARRNELHNVELTAITTIGMPDLLAAGKETFFINSLFVSKDVRDAVNSDIGDYAFRSRNTGARRSPHPRIRTRQARVLFPWHVCRRRPLRGA